MVRFQGILDSEHVALGFSQNLLPATDPLLLTDTEWIPSEIVFPVDGGAGGTGAANQQTMHIVGNNVPPGNFQVNTGTSFSLIEAYANSRRTQEVPDPSTTGVSETTNPYATLSVSDAMYQDVAENLIDNNNLPPYPMDHYPGGADLFPAPELFDRALLNNLGDLNSFSTYNTGPLIAPFGLLKFSPQSFDPEAVIFMEITLAPGNYKGILAERGV